MKLLAVTLKDLLQSTRSLMAIVFMFVVPIGVTLLFFLMFGGIGGDDEASFELPRTIVIIANLDEGSLPAGADLELNAPSGSSLNLSGARSMGGLLSQILQDETFADLMDVSEAAGETAARTAVDNQEAGIAIIIPANFSDAIMGPEQGATVELYRDPTLTFGPSIVESIVRQILDGFSASTIGINVAANSLAEAGLSMSPAIIQELMAGFAAGPAGSGVQQSGTALVVVQAAAGSDEPTSLIAEIVGTILGGMMVFFAFFTGSAGMESILTEEERGTLARLFTTPTDHRTILGGKGLAVFIMLLVQVTVLLTFGALVFNVDWGDPLPIILAGLGIVLLAAATGLFLVSMLKDTRQGGVIFGGVLTLTGMIGLIPVFTAGVPNQPAAVETASLLVPQGWAVRNLMIAMDGGTVADMAPYLAGVLVWALVFTFIGQRRLQKRFA